MEARCPHCNGKLGEAILPDPIGRKVKLNRNYKDDDFFLHKGTEGVVCSDLGDDWFIVNFNGLKLGTPSDYLEQC